MKIELGTIELNNTHIKVIEKIVGKSFTSSMEKFLQIKIKRCLENGFFHLDVLQKLWSDSWLLEHNDIRSMIKREQNIEYGNSNDLSVEEIYDFINPRNQYWN